MTFNQFLISTTFNFLSNTLPLAIAVYFAIRLAISHGEISFRRRKNIASISSAIDRSGEID